MIDSFNEFLSFITQYMTKEMIGNMLAAGFVLSGLWTAFDICWDVVRRPPGRLSYLTAKTSSLFGESVILERQASIDEGHVTALRSQLQRLAGGSIAATAPRGAASGGSGFSPGALTPPALPGVPSLPSGLPLPPMPGSLPPPPPPALPALPA
jgi:hypothetical protein